MHAYIIHACLHNTCMLSLIPAFLHDTVPACLHDTAYLHAYMIHACLWCSS